jgi:hypothetical protein
MDSDRGIMLSQSSDNVSLSNEIHLMTGDRKLSQFKELEL